MKHISVMRDEVIDYLNPRKGGEYIDATCGEGGHTKAIFEKIDGDGKIALIDQNAESIKKAEKVLEKHKDKTIFVHNNFAQIKDVAKKYDFTTIDGVIYDLGLASWQIDDSGLGISFSKDEVLDMRLGKDAKNTAREIVNKFSVKKIADILYQYGDVRGSWGIARRIEIARRNKNIETTWDLRDAIGSKNPKILAPIFQALRIYVNNEYENLEKSLSSAIDLTKSGGRIVVISFHSGEDRIVKNIFRQAKKDGKVKILTKKPILPTEDEIRLNSRSRSAKLRAVEKN